MLAPPGYAKMVSTPSRSRHATSISLPDIVGPSSARLADDFFAVFIICVFTAFVAGRRRGCRKKPTTVFQPWVLAEIQLSFDKRLRRRLRRRPAEQFVELSITSLGNLVNDSSLVKSLKLAFSGQKLPLIRRKSSTQS